MNEKLLITFIVLNAINVIIQTTKSLCTIKCGKFPAALINALAYGFYTVVVVYMVCELPLMWKVLIVGTCNFIGVYLVKWFEEKMRKDKLWKVEATINPRKLAEVEELLEYGDIPFNYIDLKKYVVLNIYCETQKQSAVVREILNNFDAKYFVSESKNL